MAVRQKDIADYLGLSRQIVGNALSGSGRISHETRERVLLAARDLGYTEHSNQAARSLIAQRYRTRSRIGTFGVLMPKFAGESKRKAPYFIPILDGIEEEADAQELAVFLHSFKAGYVPPMMSNFLLDGLIGLASSVGRVEWMHLHGLPMVLIDHGYPGVSHINADTETGIALCTQHLIDLGHRKICYFSQDATPGYALHCLRFNSFAATMERNGLAADPEHWYRCERMLRDSARESMSIVLEKSFDFTAIVCYNDLLAMGVVDALRESGLRVPDDVSITGFDDITGDYKFSPEITSVAFDREEVGRQAVRMLYQHVDCMITDPLTEHTAKEVVMPVNLVVHESTSRPKASQDRISHQ